jgi:phosphoribosylformylglycinamidine synthase
MRDGCIRACHDISEGGLAVALAEMALGGGLGVDCPWLGHDDLTVALFSESSSRFVCEIDPGDLDWLTMTIGEPVHVLGAVTDEAMLRLGPLEVPLDDARTAFSGVAR